MPATDRGSAAVDRRGTSRFRTAVTISAVVWLLIGLGGRRGAAEGFGLSAGGGEGSLYSVTSLGEAGGGTLRDAVSRGDRRVVFAVAGTITLRKEIRIRGSNVTIDGSSAPSPGITLGGAGIRIDGRQQNVVIRGIRVRDPVRDGITIKNGASRIVVDHVSIDGCGDGNIDIGRGAHDVTIAWSVLSGCRKNMLIGHGAGRISLHHNAFVHSQWRNPWVKNQDDGIVADDTTIDIRNNLVWGWGSSGGGTGVTCGGKANVVKNFYSSPDTSRSRQENALIVERCAGGGAGGFVYASGNLSADGLGFDINGRGNRAEPFPAPPITTTDACRAAKDVLAGAGVRPWDAVDRGHLETIAIRCPENPRIGDRAARGLSKGENGS